MNFIISDEQKNLILSALQDLPLKNTFQSAHILLSLPQLKNEMEIKEDKKDNADPV